jgi:hypothetical protein
LLHGAPPLELRSELVRVRIRARVRIRVGVRVRFRVRKWLPLNLTRWSCAVKRVAR